MRAASALDYRELARRRLPHFLFVVSNHGGRQLDDVPSTAAALPPIADAVRDRLTILADGGVRSGLGLCAGGRRRSGGTHMLRLVEAEMRVQWRSPAARTSPASRATFSFSRNILIL